MALVKYNSSDEAANAKKALNMCVVGSTMLVATVATDQDVSILCDSVCSFTKIDIRFGYR